MDIVTRQQINILVQLAEVDRAFVKSERKLIQEIARKKNFPEKELNKLLRNPEPIGSLGALTQEQKLDYLYSIVELMKIDNKIFQSEILFCQHIAVKLGFRKEVIDFLTDVIDVEPSTTSPDREAIKEQAKKMALAVF